MYDVTSKHDLIIAGLLIVDHLLYKEGLSVGRRLILKGKSCYKKYAINFLILPKTLSIKVKPVYPVITLTLFALSIIVLKLNL